MRGIVAPTLFAAWVCGCTPAPLRPSSAAERTPSPGTVTHTDPAGDAASPVDAALERLAVEALGVQSDRPHTLYVPLPDAANWQRVRFLGYPTRAGFRYGEDHYAVAVVLYEDAGGDAAPVACLERFTRRAVRTARLFELEVGPLDRELRGDTPLMRASARFVTLLERDRYVAAVAARPSWPGTCLVHGFAARIGTDAALAHAVVDRWARELASELRWQPTVTRAPPRDDR
jgi:hypothetical protein